MTTPNLGDDGPNAEQDAADPSSEQVGAQVRGVLATLYRRIRQSRQIGDLTMPESSMLVRLQQGGPMTAAALAKLEQISPQAISVTGAALDAKGLIRRSADPADGRRVILSLTSPGDATVQARRDARDQNFNRALSALSAQERRRLLQAIPVLERLVEEL